MSQVINLLPREDKVSRKRYIYLRLGVLFLVIECILFTLIIILQPLLERYHLTNKISTFEVLFKEIPYVQIQSIMNDYDDLLREAEYWRKKAECLNNERIIDVSVLDSLLGRVPIGVEVSTVKMSIESDREINQQGRIEIEGNSETILQIMNYIGILEDYFGEEYISYDMEYTGELLYGYYLTISLDRFYPKEATAFEYN